MYKDIKDINISVKNLDIIHQRLNIVDKGGRDLVIWDIWIKTNLKLIEKVENWYVHFGKIKMKKKSYLIFMFWNISKFFPKPNFYV